MRFVGKRDRRGEMRSLSDVKMGKMNASSLSADVADVSASKIEAKMSMIWV